MRIVIIFLLTVTFLNANAQNANTTIRRGNDAYNNKKFKDAEIDYKSALEKDAKSYAGNYNLGNAYYKQDNMEEAGKQYMQSAGSTKDPIEQSKAYYNLGNTYLKADKFQESVDAYKMALRQNPKDDDARYNLAYAMAKLKAQQQKNNQQQKNQQQKNQQKNQQQQQQQQQQNKNQDQKKDQQKQQQQQQQQGQDKKSAQPKISKEEAERMLQALKNQEQKLQKKNAKKFDSAGGNPEKDW
ncbi:MAG: tetratricopeptide repeat protein [Bacteroidota bacterium]